MLVSQSLMEAVTSLSLSVIQNDHKTQNIHVAVLRLILRSCVSEMEQAVSECNQVKGKTEHPSDFRGTGTRS